MSVIPAEGTKIALKVSASFVDIAQVLSIKPPGGEVTKVATTNLASAMKAYRPGKIPDAGEVTFRIQYDPSNTNHIALASRVALPGTIDEFKITYNDGKTTPANETFSGFILKFEPDTDEDDKNVEADLTIVLTTIPIRTAGTP